SKAEIIFKPLAGSYNAPFSLPKRLVLFQPDPNTGLNYLILDYLNNTGEYDAINNQYKFNVTRHVQNLFNDKIFRNTDNNLGFYLAIPSDSPLTPSRIALDTRKGIAGGFALKLYYTKL
ncbi:MAG: hypothetical protein H7321_09400, partial [Bacteroidia bacterium]|nr:hypothetical protein [Bacteroidia bacterium]